MQKLDRKKKKTLAGYSHVICIEMAEKLESGALVQQNCNLRVHSFNTTRECIVCRKKISFVIPWNQLDRNQITVKVNSISTVCNHPEAQSSRPVKGNFRTEIGKEVQGKSTTKYINENVI